jgi:hypothetical protein
MAAVVAVEVVRGGGSRRGFIPLVRPSLDRLIEQSFFLSPQLDTALIALAGEDPSCNTPGP